MKGKGSKEERGKEDDREGKHKYFES